VDGEIVADGLLQRSGAAMGAALDLFLGEQWAPALDPVDPGR
jgi:hypothetical protein